MGEWNVGGQSLFGCGHESYGRRYGCRYAQEPKAKGAGELGSSLEVKAHGGFKNDVAFARAVVALEARPLEPVAWPSAAVGTSKIVVGL